MPFSLGASFRHNPWDKPSENKPPVNRKRFTLHDGFFETKQKEKDNKPLASHNWNTVKKAVNAARFWKRIAITTAGSQTGVDLGSLKSFIDKRKLNIQDITWTAEQEKTEKEKVDAATQAKKVAESSRPNTSRLTTAASRSNEAYLSISPDTDEIPNSSRPHTVPAAKYGGSRRTVEKLGMTLTLARVQSPRHKQLTKMIPDKDSGDAWAMAWARTEGLPPAGTTNKKYEPPQKGTCTSLHAQNFKVGTGRFDDLGRIELRPITAPTQPKPQKARPAIADRETGFTVAMFDTSTAAKPRAEVHPLLTAIEGMQHDEISEHAVLESGVLAQRLDELRWHELRKGTWTNRPEKKEKLQDVSPVKQQDGQGGAALDPGRQLVSAAIARSGLKAGVRHIHGNSDQMERILRIMDPDKSGLVAPEVLVPLFFWLGLTRRRSSALMTLELAFGPGDIDVVHVRELLKYAEVQVRLIEGLRQMARRESLEQLCEYITDMIRLRTWFHTMKRDTTGRADIVEVQNLFARMELTSDRQTLFRFLTHVVQSEVLPSAHPDRSEKHGGQLNVANRTFGISDFASLLGRCAVSWILFRTVMLIDPSDKAWKTSGEDGFLMAPAADLDREAEMRWVQLQRKIIISLLVNHRFWGRESRTVLMCLNQPQMTTLGNQLSPDQWLSLFQRVRAQGIASTLPVGDEASDPEWLFKKVASGDPRGKRLQVNEGAVH